ncbi:hypothetical protein COT63_00430 [Candidatus Shapirobacteria bacterium CG09_land_8_20_14_0_10_38_17]|uniref:Fibronectin type-III domain-containing protein n=1 Tax=Candidatus Shapirobacteria bacterium CG09_land_8_20_14_0_10_38_17 TaxID=1974884 RepID=A0A2H0WRP8_9BACT|nr:MAG: hypothetical protein COT63_00430 [Candidatus Shapirobacteria bacterium CG09_land_8_20_14_0_10_38_17]
MDEGKTNKKMIVVVLVSLFGIAIIVGVVLSMGKIRTFLGGATGSLRPGGVRVTNITANSATVIWQTSKAVAGQIEYGTTPGSFLLRNTETTQTSDHSLVLSPLLPETIYYFRIRIGEEVYDENGAPYSFTTKGAVVSVPKATVSPLPTLPISTPSAAVTKAPSATSSATQYTLDDFQAKFGSSDSEFDINKDGVVNSADWILYQEQ